MITPITILLSVTHCREALPCAISRRVEGSSACNPSEIIDAADEALRSIRHLHRLNCAISEMNIIGIDFCTRVIDIRGPNVRAVVKASPVMFPGQLLLTNENAAPNATTTSR